MKLALIVDDYLPHSTRVGAKMMHELACEFMRQGHQVTVITPHFEKASPSFVKDQLDGILIWRFFSGPIKDTGKIKRAINETLLSLRAWKSISSLVDQSTFDGIVYYSPTIFFGNLVKRMKKRCKCNSYLVLRDFFPQWAVDSGLIKSGSLIEHYFRFFEKITYNQADMIGVMSQRNLDIFHESTQGKYPASVLRNWANLIPHHESQGTPTIRERLGLKDEVIYFYGGNIGHAQDMANLMRLARRMSVYTNAYFLFVGQGDEVELIKRLAVQWELANFTYWPSVDQSVFHNILAQVDVGLFSLSSKHSTHNFPGKLLGYMVQSLPILGSVNKGNDLIELVNDSRSGFICVNGDDEAFYSNAMKLHQSSELREQVGSNGYRLLEAEFSVSNIATGILCSLKGGYESI